MYSADGGRLEMTGKTLVYVAPSAEATQCKFSKETELWVCENGVTSPLTTARLPLSFEGALFAKFDGRTFNKSTLSHLDDTALGGK